MVVSGAGAAGVAVARILLNAGVDDIAVVDRKGVLNSRRTDLTPVKRALAVDTGDRHDRHGSLAEVMAGADVYLGVSGGTVPEEVVASMAADAIVFGARQPDPRGAASRSPTGMPGWSRPDARTIPTRSTTCSPSPASSGAPSTCTPPRSPRA